MALSILYLLANKVFTYLYPELLLVLNLLTLTLLLFELFQFLNYSNFRTLFYSEDIICLFNFVHKCTFNTK